MMGRGDWDLGALRVPVSDEVALSVKGGFVNPIMRITSERRGAH